MTDTASKSRVIAYYTRREESSEELEIDGDADSIGHAEVLEELRRVYPFDNIGLDDFEFVNV